MKRFQAEVADEYIGVREVVSSINRETSEASKPLGDWRRWYYLRIDEDYRERTHSYSALIWSVRGFWR